MNPADDGPKVVYANDDNGGGCMLLALGPLLFVAFVIVVILL